MKTKPRFTQLALATGIATALAMAFPTAQATPLTSAEQYLSPGAIISLQTGGYTVPNTGVLITSATEKTYGPGYTIIGIAFDTMPLGYTDAKYTFYGANVNPAATLGANNFSAHDATSNVNVISATGFGNAANKISTMASDVNVFAAGKTTNVGTFSLSDDGIHLSSSEITVNKLFSQPDRWAVHIDFVLAGGATFATINGGQVGGTTG